MFHPLDPGPPSCSRPTRAGPASDESTAREQSINLTWQATEKDKLKLYWTNSAVRKPHFLQGRTLVSIFITPEAAFSSVIDVNNYQIAWTRPQTNRLLFEAGVSHEPFRFDLLPAPGAVTDIPGILEFSPVRASRNMSGWLSGPTVRYSPKTVNYYRGSVSYVTGSHNLKIGFNLNTQETSVSQHNDRRVGFPQHLRRLSDPRELLGQRQFDGRGEAQHGDLRAGAVDGRPADREPRVCAGTTCGRLSRPVAADQHLGCGIRSSSRRRTW